MDFTQKITDLCTARGLSVRQMEREIELGNGAVSKWKNNIPSGKVLVKLSDYFGVSIDFLLDRAEDADGYYSNAEAAALAQEMATRPELKVLLSASRDVSKEDLEAINQMVLRMAERNR